MKIRALTLGYDIYHDNYDLQGLRHFLGLIQELKNEIQKYYEVEYIRLASPPYTSVSSQDELKQILNDEIVCKLDGLIVDGLMGIYSFAPGLLDFSESLEKIQSNLTQSIPRLLKEHHNMFSSMQIGSTQRGLNFQGIDLAADIIFALADPDPFRNVQFAATFNVPTNTPFFPSAYHTGSKPKLSIALEAADELVSIFDRKNVSNYSLQQIKTEIQKRFCQIYDQITEIVIPFCEKNQIEFVGIDFSPAPYPSKSKSIGNALEQLGFCQFGSVGSVFSVGFITQALQSVNRPKIGFSGFMQPLLEDFIIAQRNNEGKVDLSKLLLYSTMCGLGLDCVPIPGDLPREAVKLLLMDLGMISIRLNKPLTARLMPIPNRKAGEFTNFSFEYFTDSKICPIDFMPLNEWDKIRKNNSYYSLS
ncbi:MAG: DUF711 family protein [Candidatus Lokiarchaeota archaeon]|nr:DUF711 family protein [Candidatus Harpocratesius repetitus]